MISTIKKIEITQGQSPYNYSWVTDNSCITFDSISGTTDFLVETVITYSDEDCLQNSNVSLIITDAKGCQNEFPVNVRNECNNFNIGPINSLGNGVFSVVPSGGTPPYIYQWYYDGVYWDAAVETDNILTLTASNNVPEGLSTEIQAYVTDSKGCFQSNSIIYNFCRPIAVNTNVIMACGGYNRLGNSFYSKNFTLTANECDNPIDWKTLEFSGQPLGLSINHPFQNDNTELENYVEIYTESLSGGTYTFFWRVADTSGLYSDYATINVVIGQCTLNPTDPECSISVADCNCITVECDATEVEIDLDDYIITPNSCGCEGVNEIDWSTFAIIAGPYQPGATVSFNPFTHVLTYTLGSGNGADLIRWAVQDSNGIFSGNISISIILECDPGPIAANDLDCANCGEPLTINVLTNDNPNGGSDIDPDSIIVTQAPANGVHTVGSGTITYIPNSNFSGQEIIKYRVANFDNILSNEATITIDVYCAGQPSSVTVC